MLAVIDTSTIATTALTWLLVVCFVIGHVNINFAIMSSSCLYIGYILQLFKAASLLTTTAQLMMLSTTTAAPDNYNQ